MEYGVVVGGTLNRRSLPVDGAQTYGQYSDGAYISIENYNTDWYKTFFTYNGTNTTGYVKKAFVVMVGDSVEVRKTNVRVRSGAGTNYGELYQISVGVTGFVADITKNTTDGFGWIKSNYGNGVGWVRGDMFNKFTSGGSGGDTSSTYNCVTIPGGAYAYSQMDTSSDRFLVDAIVTVVDQGYDQWMYYPGQVEPRYFQRKNIDVSYDSNKHPDTVFGSGVLKNGSSGRYVMHLQHYINRYLFSKGYQKITVDGVFGGTTEQKVEAFQDENGLLADGEVGTLTKNAFLTFVKGLG